MTNATICQYNIFYIYILFDQTMILSTFIGYGLHRKMVYDKAQGEIKFYFL